MNPAYGLYRLFGGKSPTSGDDDSTPPYTPVPPPDQTKSDAYKAMLARGHDIDAQGAAAEPRRRAAFRALQALRTAPAASYSPVAVTVPSFTLGRRH